MRERSDVGMVLGKVASRWGRGSGVVLYCAGGKFPVCRWEESWWREIGSGFKETSKMVIGK